jgi:endonuclease YncB( thermonuclease family)
MFRFIKRLFRSLPARKTSKNLECGYNKQEISQGVYLRENKTPAAKLHNSQKFLSAASHISGLPKADVKWVIDGDTIVVSIGGKRKKIRLDSIDCPEDDQEWGSAAKCGLVKLIGGQSIHFEQQAVDIYGRIVATIYVWNETKNEWSNVNERMVTLGHAWVMRLYYNHLSEDRKNKLNQLERWARSKKVGLWRSQNPMPPWNWRNKCKDTSISLK